VLAAEASPKTQTELPEFEEPSDPLLLLAPDSSVLLPLELPLHVGEVQLEIAGFVDLVVVSIMSAWDSSHAAAEYASFRQHSKVLQAPQGSLPRANMKVVIHVVDVLWAWFVSQLKPVSKQMTRQA